jgi:hypothetical protein
MERSILGKMPEGRAPANAALDAIDSAATSVRSIPWNLAERQRPLIGSHPSGVFHVKLANVDLARSPE